MVRVLKITRQKYTTLETKKILRIKIDSLENDFLTCA